MKTISYLFIILAIMCSNIRLHAQSAFKIGGNVNAEIANHKAGEITYASWEAAWEKLLAKKWSFSAGVNYAQRRYNPEMYTSMFFRPHQFLNKDWSIFVEGRFYPQQNASGLFFLTGIQGIYTTEKRTSYSYFGETFPSSHSYMDLNTYAGFGLKHPLSERMGIEMSITVSPLVNYFNQNYGTSGYIKTGIKLMWLKKKK
jgi:hypothetical protein